MNKKAPNKTPDEEEGLSFEDSVLTMLADLQHYTKSFRETSDKMNGIIRDFRTSIHGEDIDDHQSNEDTEERKKEWICKRCGKSTFETDYEYLAAQNEHLECALIHGDKNEQKIAK
jgi:hypothetical protein